MVELKPPNKLILENIREMHKCRVECGDDGVCKTNCGCIPKEQARKSVGIMAFDNNNNQKMDKSMSMKDAWKVYKELRCPDGTGN